jgi:four helix bundle protein
MSREYQKLRVWIVADDVVMQVYRATARMPPEERYALQSQIRRAAVSVPTNLVEGSSRQSKNDYLHFVNIALGSASELRYLIDLAKRLGFVSAQEASELDEQLSPLLKGLQRLITTLRTETSSGRHRPLVSSSP